LVVANFLQIELRVTRYISKESKAIDAYCNKRDLHRETAALIQGVELDQVTKEQKTRQNYTNFELAYAASFATLWKQAIAQYGTYLTRLEAKQLVNDFREACPKLYQWQQDHGTKATELDSSAVVWVEALLV